MKKYLFLILLLPVTWSLSESAACTTFIISGKYTPDGKPVLYKHRDTGTLDNTLAYFNDGTYPYIGVVNGTSNWSREVWGGYNSQGFAIINSVAYNMNSGDTTTFENQEGELMKMALMSCASVDDFEKMLNELPKPLGVDTNFGVIDAFGGAAYFETGNYSFIKIDVNDPAVAPFGYLIRTNHAFTGSHGVGAGYIRYATAENILYQCAATGMYDPQFMINNISRNLNHSLTGVNLATAMPANEETPDFRFFEDFIPRISTASVMMIIGASRGEDPLATVMWTILGFPLTSAAVPVWMTSDGSLAKSLSAGRDYHAPLCDAALLLKAPCFPVIRGSGKKYINLAKVLNQEGTGTMQKIEKIEKEIFRRAESQPPGFGKNRDDSIKEFNLWLDNYLELSYQEQFGLNLFPLNQ